ncbi:MAG: 4-(cytidine 5'-diphospho)-2-C-methyl-D-erythritol kinase [Endomicrobiia bacterium]
MTLKILNKRKDGYHNIFSIIQTVSLFDKIKISIKLKKNVSENKLIINCNIPELKNENNLCYKVAETILKKFKIENYFIKIDIEKNIPIGGGLGGASSDAACVALALVKLFKIKITKEKLIKILAKLGKDIPFFLFQGCCIVKSAGEKIKKIIPPWTQKPLWFVLVYPNVILSTKKVYETYDKITKNSFYKFDENKILDSIKKINLKTLLINDLEKAAFKVFPELKKIKQIMNRFSENVSMSGSGSCFFSVFKNKKEAEFFKKIVEKKLKNCKIYILKSITK